MQVADRILKMEEGNSTILDYSGAEGYGSSWEKSPYSYTAGTNIGIVGGNTYLPVIEDDQLGRFDIANNAPWSEESECVPNLKGECTYVNTRRYVSSNYKDWGYNNPGEMLPQFQSPDAENFGAWNFKSLITKQELGESIWSRSAENIGDFSTTELGDLANTLKVGDMVTFSRKDGSNPYKDYDDPNFEEEAGVTHIGTVKGQASDGVLIIEHSYKNKKGEYITYQERIDKMQDYNPSSILRLGKKGEANDKGGLKKVQIDNSPLGNNDNNSVVKEDIQYSIKLPGRFKSSTDFNNYLTGMSDTLKYRLKAMRYDESHDSNFFSIKDSYNEQLIKANFTVWKSAEEIAADQRIQTREDKRAKKQSRMVKRNNIKEGLRTFFNKKQEPVIDSNILTEDMGSEAMDAPNQMVEDILVARKGGILYKHNG